MTKKIILSLSILLSISSVLAYLFCNGTIISFVRCVTLFTAIQIILHFGITYAIDLSYLKKVRQEEANLYKSISAVTYSLPCPCHIKNVQSTRIELGKDNTYTCERCQKQIATDVQITNALKTVPINYPEPELLRQLDETVKKLKLEE